ncbi:hypothetical protein [Nonomuraea sp. NPDC050202]|uniref:hypothetical protein n=1 Tax=Nonomuraea sp. NPDC050202 TaxID=3155035 RepID=UPI003408D19D
MLTGDRLDDATVTGRGQPWHHLRYEHTAWIREQIDQMDWSPAYRNKHLAALRGVLKEAWKLGLLSTDDHQRAVALAPFGGHREPAGQHVPDTVIGALIAACDADRSPAGDITGAGLRDAAIIACRDRQMVAVGRTVSQGCGRNTPEMGRGDFTARSDLRIYLNGQDQPDTSPPAVGLDGAAGSVGHAVGRQVDR